MRKIILALLCALYFNLTPAQTLEIKDMLRNPALSSRCKTLLHDRHEKVEYKQKLQTLLRKNTKLIKKLKERKDSIQVQLDLNEAKIKQQLNLATLRVKTMEEDIIRSGCPGISL